MCLRLPCFSPGLLGRCFIRLAQPRRSKGPNILNGYEVISPPSLGGGRRGWDFSTIMK